jgi:uncharacterized protein YndB with AHSA1/START domain
VTTILHVVDVPAAPKEVFQAISTIDGLTRWWTTKVSGDEKAGGAVRFAFVPNVFNPEMQIETLDEPTSMRWRCVGGAEQWVGATIAFDLEERDDGTRLMFRQNYDRPLDDVSFGIYNFNWGYYLESLRLYVESGEGRPFRPQ